MNHAARRAGRSRGARAAHRHPDAWCSWRCSRLRMPSSPGCSSDLLRIELDLGDAWLADRARRGPGLARGRLPSGSRPWATDPVAERRAGPRIGTTELLTVLVVVDGDLPRLRRPAGGLPVRRTGHAAGSGPHVRGVRPARVLRARRRRDPRRGLVIAADRLAATNGRRRSSGPSVWPC